MPPHPELPQAFFPAHLPGSLIEAVFATRPAEPQAGQGVSAAFCRYFDIECHRADRWQTPVRTEQYTISRFILDCRSLESETMERAVFGAPSTFPGTDRSRAEIVLDAAEALRDAGVEVLQDVRDRLPVFIEKVLGPVSGDGSEPEHLLLMLTGSDRFVLADESVREFVQYATRRRSRIALSQAARSIVGLGVVTETAHSWDDGERTLDLRGRLGVERLLGDAETVVDVSGERLGSEAARTRVVLGLGAAHRWSRWSLGGEVSASGIGSDDSDYTVSLRLGTQF